MNKFQFYSLFFFWICGVAACIVAIERYATTAGALAPTDTAWPANAAVALDEERPTAVLFAHPKCPCSQASLQEFQRIEARHPERFRTAAVFTVPEVDTQDWTETRLVAMARNLQSGEVTFDRGGVEAARFQARVSGQVLLFSPEGRLLFSGGVTPARGHEGNNGGQEAFEYMLDHPDAEPQTFPVFGCALINPAAPSGPGGEA